MSTTASTSKVPHTLVGTRVKKEKGPFPFFLSVLLIRRGGKQFIQQRLEELCSESVDEIILIDHPDTGLDLEQLISTYPRLRVLLLDPQLTLGHQINLGIEEAQGKWVCLQWTDMSWGPMPAGSKFWQDNKLLISGSQNWSSRNKCLLSFQGSSLGLVESCCYGKSKTGCYG